MTYEILLAEVEVKSVLLCSTDLNSESLKIFEFETSVNVNINDDSDKLSCEVQVLIYNENKSTVLGSIITNCVFIVKNIESLISKTSDNTSSAPIELLHIVTSISISTTRGVMVGYFKGTSLDKAILPIIDPKKLFE